MVVDELGSGKKQDKEEAAPDDYITSARSYTRDMPKHASCNFAFGNNFVARTHCYSQI
jgi:hypothetical protein